MSTRIVLVEPGGWDPGKIAGVVREAVSIKHGLGIKCGLRTEYKTRTTNYVKR